KRTPFTPVEMNRARTALAEAGMIPVYLPDQVSPNAFNGLIRSESPESFIEGYRYDIAPTTDNRPFFFYTIHIGDLWKSVLQGKTEDLDSNVGVVTLYALLGASLLATAV